MSRPLVFIRMRNLANASDARMSASARSALRALSWEVQAYENALFEIYATFHGNPTKFMEAAQRASEIADKALENLDRAAETQEVKHD